MTTLSELIACWDSNEGKPHKGDLIDWSAYDPDNFNIGCMCAQGQVLHLIGGWTPEKLGNTEQPAADAKTAELLNISSAHAILLRHVNDKADGAPSIVLNDPGKVLGSQWSKLLDFWWHIDQFTAEQWDAAMSAARSAAMSAAGDAAWEAAWEAAWDAAGDAAGSAAMSAAGDAAGSAAMSAAWNAAGDAAWNAAGEIQGAAILIAANHPFYFLPLFGFATPDDIPARPANYGEVA